MVLSSLKDKLRPNRGGINQRQLRRALDYIDAHWKQLERNHTEDKGTLVGLPHPYVVPASEESAAFRFEEQYYWDSYFTALGLHDEKHRVLIEGMLDNLIYLFKRFGVIPNASRMYFTGRSQPPLLTSFIFHVYDTYGKDDKWLKQKIEVALEEYETVWMNKQHPKWHNVFNRAHR